MTNRNIGKILVVDDEVELKNVLVEALAAQGYETVGFASGETALAALREEAFDVLLTDLMMPGLDGITLVREGLHIDPHLVCMMMTGQGTIQTAVDAMKEGAFDYVLKPFRLQTVLPLLTRAMNTRRMRLENLHLRDTVAIYELARTVASTLDPLTVVGKLADAALRQTDADEVSVLLPTTEGDELYVAAVRGENHQRLLGERVPLGESISSWVAHERIPLILDGEIKDDRFRALWPRPEIRSAISVPMQVDNKLVGTININALNRARPFTLGQMKALTILAGTAAAALESASLYTQVWKAEENYRSIFDNAIEGLFQTTPDGRLLTANPALARILGYDSPAEIVASITDIAQQLFVNPDDRAEAARLQEVGGTLEGLEFEAYRKNREKIWLSMNRRAVHDQDGKVLYLEGSVEDITARRQIEEEKRKTRQQYESLVHTIDGIVWELDVRTFAFTFVSKQSERLLGYLPEQWLSDPNFWMDHLHPDDRSWALAFCLDATARKADHELDYRMIAADGRLVWLRDIVTVDYSEPDFPRLRGVMVDITERKLAEDELKQSEERYRDLVENSLELITTHDLDGRLLSANRAAAKALGYEREGHLGVTNLRQVLVPEVRDQFDEYLTRIRKVGVDTGLMQVQTKAGERRIWEYYNSLRTEGVGAPIVRSVARDITERKRAESRLGAQYMVTRALADSGTLEEAMPKILRALCETLGWAWGGCWTVDPGANVLRCQDVWHDPSVQMAGFEAASRELTFAPGAGFPGRVWADGKPAWIRDVAQDKSFSRAQIAAGENFHGALAVPVEARAEVFGVMEFFSKAIREPDPELLSMMATVSSQIGQFIERRRLDENLRQSEEKYRTILERMEEGYAEVDLSGTYVFVNDSYCRITGRPRSELLGVNYQEIFDGELRQLLYDTYHDVYITGEPITGFEFEVTRKDGTRRFVEESVSLKRDAAGRPIGFMGIRRDCTERKQAEEELKQSEDKYRGLIETMQEGLGVQDNKGLITFMNRRGCEILGYKQEELIGSPVALVFDEQNQRILQEQMSRRTTGEHHSYEIAWLRKDGGKIDTIIAPYPRFGDKGEFLETVAVFTDITERRRVEKALRESEDQLRQSQKMEAIGQLAGGVAHDFNNLLTAINGYSGLALQRIDDNHPLKSFLEEIKKAGDRAANLTRQLLAFGRKQILQPLPINLNDIVTDMNKMLQRLIGENIALTAKLDPALPNIKADPGQIEQVLVNLIVNARDAMPQGGKLTIETLSVELDQDYAHRHVGVVPGDYVMLAVSDTGTGMDEDTEARIFDPFFTTKEKGKGTGLGLSTVYGIIKQSGGHIWVYTEFGHGSTFKVYLPELAATVQKGEAVAIESPLSSGSETILLVEDEDVVRCLARTILENAGYHVLEASRGREAIRLWQELEQPIDLLLTDVVMPEASGKEVADRLREMQPALKVLFMSGYTDEAIVHHGVLDADVEFIQKPFTPAGLAGRVREVLDSELVISGSFLPKGEGVGLSSQGERERG